MTTLITYRCETALCTLGTLSDHGHFTGGMTREQKTLLTGQPEPDHYGDGVCPNCGNPGFQHPEP